METVTRENGVTYLADNSIEDVKIDPLPTRTRAEYTEEPTRYKVRLNGEKIWRRVYAHPFGNSAMIYLKSKGENIICEDELNRILKSKIA